MSSSSSVVFRLSENQKPPPPKQKYGYTMLLIKFIKFLIRMVTFKDNFAENYVYFTVSFTVYILFHCRIQTWIMKFLNRDQTSLLYATMLGALPSLVCKFCFLNVKAFMSLCKHRQPRFAH